MKSNLNPNIEKNIKEGNTITQHNSYEAMTKE